MRLRIRRRHDYSWPLGWFTLALLIAFFVLGGLFGHVCYSPDSGYASGNFYTVTGWCGGLDILRNICGVGALIGFLGTVLLTFATTPPGKGWRPALGAVVVWIMVVFYALGRSG